MKYTLDSIKLQIAALEQKYLNTKFDSKPLFTENLYDLCTHQDKIFYYGVLTHGASTFDCEIFFNDNLSVTIVENSQIEILFTDLFGVKDGLAQSKYRGQFIGFQIFEVKK
jgi:hypothetical protein